MSKGPYKREKDTHLPWPQDAWGSRKLDRLFLNETGLDPISLLRKLDKEFDIGGAVPYLTIRGVEPGRSAMIVVRNTWDGSEKSTGVAADGMTEAQARLHPTARAELVKHAAEKVLRLQARHAPTTIRYSRILRWWLDKRLKRRGAARDKPEAILDRKRGNFATQDMDNRDGHRVETWMEFLEERTLVSHTANVGDNFNDWFRKRLVEAGAPIVGDQVKGGQDGTVANYHSCLSQALGEFAEEYRLAVRLSFNKTRGEQDYQQKLAAGITWTDIVKVVFFCLGYHWNGDGFAWEWVERNGKMRQWPLRLSGKQLAEHLAFYMPVIRLVMVYVITGTRLQRIALLGWEKHDTRGWIDLARRMIIRNGRLGPDYEHKPRRPSRLLRPAVRLFARWFRDDQARQRAEAWDDVEDGGFYVVHDGCGSRVDNIAYRAKKAFVAVGIPNRRHDLKASAVGIFWEAGFGLSRIGHLTGNDPVVIKQHYLFLEADSEGMTRPKPDESKLTFLGFMDPKKLCRRLPRASRPGPPPPNPRRQKSVWK